MELILRKATIEDLHMIKQIYKNEKEHIGNFNRFMEWNRYIQGNKISFTFVVVDGMAFCRYGWSVRYKHFVIYEIGVLPEHKRKGISRFILEQLPRPLMLKCNEDNKVGNSFYKSCGMTLSVKTQTKLGVKQNIWTL
jgi:GNAT superfamily N-acetyltransferase